MARRNNNRGGGGFCGFVMGCLISIMGCLLVIVAGFAALIFVISQNAPEKPLPNFTPSALEANNFENQIQTAANQARNSRQFNLSITETQASSWLNLNATSIQEVDFPLENLQMAFRDGKAILYGEYTDLGTPIAMQFDLILSAPAGKLEVNVQNAQVGGVGVPASIQETVAEEIQRLIDNELRSISEAYRINSINVSNGQLSIAGQVG